MDRRRLGNPRCCKLFAFSAKLLLLAGLVGLGIVALYFIAYYRLLGIVAFISLALSGSLLWIIISLLGATLTLAGLVGIVVSIGVSLDSNVVFYEHLKEDVLSGKSLRSSGEKSFPAAFRRSLDLALPMFFCRRAMVARPTSWPCCATSWSMSRRAYQMSRLDRVAKSRMASR